MSNREVSLVLKLRDEATSVFKGFVSLVKGDTDKMGDSFKRLGTLLAGAFSIYTMKASLDAFMEQEKASNALATALSNVGVTSKAVQKGMEDFSTALMRSTTFGDEAITRVQTLIVSMTGLSGAAVQPATRAILDMATALGMDAESTALLVSKAVEGGNALGRYGIQIKDTGDKTERMAAIVEALNEKFGGRAQAELNTTSGKMKALGIAVDEAKEAFGRFIAEGVAPIFPALTKVVDFLAKVIPSAILGLEVLFSSILTSIVQTILEVNSLLPKAMQFLSASQEQYLQRVVMRGLTIASKAKAELDEMWGTKNENLDSVLPAAASTKVDVLKGSFEQLRQAVSDARKELEAMKPNTAEWDIQIVKVGELEAKFRAVKEQMEFGIAVAENKWSLGIVKMANDWNRGWATMASAPKKISIGVQEASEMIAESMRGTMVRIEADLETMKTLSLGTLYAIASAFQQGFEAAFSGTMDGARTFLRALVNGIITAVESAVIAAQAAAIGLAGFTLGASLAALPKIGVAFAILEGARALLNSFHEGGTVPRAHNGAYIDAPPSHEFPIIVRGGETIRTEKQEQEAQSRMNGGGGASYVFNFYAPVAEPDWVVQSIKRALHQTNTTVDKLLVSNRNNLKLAGA